MIINIPGYDFVDIRHMVLKLIIVFCISGQARELYVQGNEEHDVHARTTMRTQPEAYQ